MRAPPLPPSFLGAPLAHRGLHDRSRGIVENSRAAIAAAIARGYGIEIDLQLSADGRAMVFHDDDLGRLTAASGRIGARSAADLGALRLDGGDEGIPTFAEVLALVGGRAALLVEIKDQTGRMGPDTGRLEAAAARDLVGYDGPLALMSFNPHSVAALARAAPHLPRGLTTCAWRPENWPDLPPARGDELRAITDFAATGASFLSHEVTDLGRPRVAELRAAGAALLCWTVRSPQVEAEARRIAQNVTFEGYAAAIPRSRPRS
jgi:glycerophosphoryl diester phosphodiesterase